jgi:DNA invertase Pin-like site-specific DNA recombinase
LAKDLRQGDVVIFTSLSRMTRGGVAAAFEILRQLEAAGAGWHFTSLPLLNFDANTPKVVRDVILAILSAVDEDYRRSIVEATRGFYKRRTALAGPNATVKDWRKPRGPDKRPRKRRSPPLPRIKPSPVKVAPSLGVHAEGR